MTRKTRTGKLVGIQSVKSGKMKLIESLLVLILFLSVVGILIYGQTFEPKFSLNEILEGELVKNSSWNCLDYSTYYNKTITEKYPLFDVRWPRHVDTCNNLTLCDSHHTFIIVAGNGGECIMDQSQIACVDVLKREMNQTNQTW